nr:hypothetical protein [Gammaproteobacteria bacterium]
MTEETIRMLDRRCLARFSWPRRSSARHPMVAAARRSRMRDAFASVLIGCIALLSASSAAAQERPERILDKPNLNGIWKAIGTAHWNLEPHSAEAIDEFWQLGAIAAIPAGKGVVEGGEIPYLPEARARRDANRAAWPEADPEAKCFLPGIPRANYMPYPFQIVQGDDDDILFIYEYASANRVVNIKTHRPAPIDTWMGVSNGRWEGDTLVVETTGLNGETWLDRAGNFAGAGATVTERFTLIDDSHMRYEATIDNPAVFSRPWTIRLVLYRLVEPDAQLFEFRCIPFSERLLYKHVLPPRE